MGLIKILIYINTFISANALVILPSKPILPTPYCSQIDKIDNAERVLSPVQALKVDRIVISKARKVMYLLTQDRVLAEFQVSFGFGFENGAKAQSGDGRTPEGLYFIDFKNAQSNYYKALRISYPNADDIKFAMRYGVSAGGDIMIHGFPAKAIDGLDPQQVPVDHLKIDWTRGCIALNNSEIDYVFAAVEIKTPVEICPR